MNIVLKNLSMMYWTSLPWYNRNLSSDIDDHKNSKQIHKSEKTMIREGKRRENSEW